MLAEVEALQVRPHVIRLPHQIDVPLTSRVMNLVNTAAFRRLSHVSQLGLVKLVYPGAVHSRFEHSLGVYYNALLFVRRLNSLDVFRDLVTVADLEATIVAALLHDIGHWPYCHPLEDIGLEQLPRHEQVAASLICNGEIAKCLEREWSCKPQLVARLIRGQSQSPSEKLLGSILSGPIDIDKMDYLYRDSLHCGVPYGMNFDAPRLIGALCLNQSQTGIAISSKGKTAAEMMVFSRYVMFSEVYWHHAVRSATAMLQRLVFESHSADPSDFAWLLQSDDQSFVRNMFQRRTNNAACTLFDGLFGDQRALYKRVLDCNGNQNGRMFSAIAHQSFGWLTDCASQLAARISKKLGIPIETHEVLIDAPPPGLEVQFKVQVDDGKCFESLEKISPVVAALAKQQFDDFVKRVRVFVHPRLKDDLPESVVESCLGEILAN